MLLSRDAIAAAVEAQRRRDRLLQAGARPHLRRRSGRSTSRVSRSTRSRVAEELRRASLLEALGGKGDAAPDPGRRRPRPRTPVTTPRSSASSRCCAGSSRCRARSPRRRTPQPDDVTETVDRAEAMVFEVAEKRISESLVQGVRLGAPRPSTSSSRSTARATRITGVPHRLHRARQHPARAPAVEPHRRRGPPGHGQDQLRARRGGERRDGRAAAGALLLDGDGSRRAHQAHARGRGARRRPQAPDRQPHRRRLAADQPRRSATSARRRSSSTTTRTAP